MFQSSDFDKIRKFVLEQKNINLQYEGGKTMMHLFIECMINLAETETPETTLRLYFNCLKIILGNDEARRKINFNLQDSSKNTPILILFRNSTITNKFKIDIINYLLKSNIYIDFDSKTHYNDNSLRDLLSINIPELIIESSIALACRRGDFKYLQENLEKNEENENKLEKIEEPLLAIIVQNVCTRKLRKYKQCLDHLLQFDHTVNFLSRKKEGSTGKTAAGYADEHKRIDIKKQLLKYSLYFDSNADIMSEEQIDEAMFEKIPIIMLKKHLDDCIIDDAGYDSYHEQYNIKFNYESFRGHNNYDMAAFKVMAQYEELEILLEHPTVQSFIHIHWLRVRSLFYIGLMIRTISFLFAMLFFTFYNSYTEWYMYLFPLTLFYLCSLGMILTSQIIQYCLILVLLITSLIPNSMLFQFYQPMIILSAIGLLFCLKGAPLLSLSKYFYLYQRVFFNFMNSMAFYCICMIAFTFAFYKNKQEARINRSNDQLENTEDSTLQTKNNFPLTILETMIMAIGGINLDEEKMNLSLFILLIIFIISVTLVLSNSLIGLAADDASVSRN